jgi:hypothetical protein
MSDLEVMPYILKRGSLIRQNQVRTVLLLVQFHPVDGVGEAGFSLGAIASLRGFSLMLKNMQALKNVSDRQS